jgi:hypothetical protein
MTYSFELCNGFIVSFAFAAATAIMHQATALTWSRLLHFYAAVSGKNA